MHAYINIFAYTLGVSGVCIVLVKCLLTYKFGYKINYVKTQCEVISWFPRFLQHLTSANRIKPIFIKK